MTSAEKRRLRMEIAHAMQAPDADIDTVSRKFGVSVKYVYWCCKEHVVSLPLRYTKAGRRLVNVFAVLKDLLAGEVMETCAIKHKVSRTRIGQIAKLAREGGWTELGEIAANHRHRGANKPPKRRAEEKAR